MPIVGARRPATVKSLARAERLVLGAEELARLDARFPVLGALRRPPMRAPQDAAAAEVVLMMGIPAPGNRGLPRALVTRGYERLNRDTVGGTLRGIVRLLDERLRDGAARVVLDNTYVTRATRSDVLRVAHARGASVRCIFFDTSLPDAQLNVVLRMIEQLGHLLGPEEIAASKEPVALGPNALLRMTRDLEPPATDEGFASIEVVPFVRERPLVSRQGIALPLDLAGKDAILARLEGLAAAVPCLLYGWRPGADAAALAVAQRFGEDIASASGRVVEVAICPHPAGRPCAGAVRRCRECGSRLRDDTGSTSARDATDRSGIGRVEDFAMIQLWTWPTPNGQKVHIALEELGLPYEVVPINIGKGEQFKPEFLAITPNHRIPAIIDKDGPGGELPLFESGAILLYLSEKSGGKLMPKGRRRARGWRRSGSCSRWAESAR